MTPAEPPRTRLWRRLGWLRFPVLVWVCWVGFTASFEACRDWLAAGWVMSAVMAFGSFLAGATSEGGGAVAFPVMTLVLGIEPPIARDFSMLIQSFGMTAASITIWQAKIPVERRALLFGGLGGAVGVVIGAEFISPIAPPPLTKLFFTSLWMSFGLAVFRIEVNTSQVQRFPSVRDFDDSKRASLFVLGVVGGAITGLLGSGIDILVFSYLVLQCRVDERVATPTSVVLMAFISVVGALWRITGSATPIQPIVWSYWWSAVPIVVVGAPLGALFIREKSRRFVLALLGGSIVVQYLGALLILPMTPVLAAFSAIVLGVGALFFGLMGNTPRDTSVVTIQDDTL